MEENRISCNTNNLGYRWVCLTCKDKNVNKVYEGETSRSARVRGSEHLRDFENKKIKSVLYKHKLADHTDEDIKFKFEITQKFKDPLSRQANEAVRITNRPSAELLNSKCEFNHPPVARVMVEKKSSNQFELGGTKTRTIKKRYI